MAVELAKGVTLELPGENENFLKDEGILFASLDKVVNWARRSSIWPPKPRALRSANGSFPSSTTSTPW